MKAFLIVAAVLGMTSSAALAECAGHQVTASKKVDREFTTASITPPPVRQSEMQQTETAAEPATEAPKTIE